MQSRESHGNKREPRESIKSILLLYRTLLCWRETVVSVDLELYRTLQGLESKRISKRLSPSFSRSLPQTLCSMSPILMLSIRKTNIKRASYEHHMSIQRTSRSTALHHPRPNRLLKPKSSSIMRRIRSAQKFEKSAHSFAYFRNLYFQNLIFTEKSSKRSVRNAHDLLSKSFSNGI